MTDIDLINFLQQDLQNERMHCLFYQQAAAAVSGLHREEFRELFLKEAQSELAHIDEFASLIVYLGGVPDTVVAELPYIPQTNSNPINLCHQAHLIESAVADNYAKRLKQIDCDGTNSNVSYVNLFYEDQLMDSKKASFEFRRLMKE